MAETFEDRPTREPPDPPARRCILLSAGGVWWDDVDEFDVFEMLADFVGGGFCPGLDDMSFR